MSDFFKTLFKWNWANVAKGVAGAAAGVLASAAFVSFPPSVIAAAVIISTVSTTLGFHAAHVAEPPKLPLGS